MAAEEKIGFIAFEDTRCIASGSLEQVALKVKDCIDLGARGTILVFNALTSEPAELDLRGTREDILARIKASPAEDGPFPRDGGAVLPTRRGRGRPKLGVVAREVTLLPRHWDWLNSQPGGASVALRKLVEEARRVNRRRDRVRVAREATYRFISVMAGNLPGFEEAARALFAGDPDRFHDLMSSWPADIRNHADHLAAGAFQDDAGENT